MPHKANKRTVCPICVTYQSDSNYKLDRHSTEEAQRHPLLQAPTKVLDCLYCRGAQIH